ncbi:MAG: NADH-quinone oxidoreductase subunit H [Vallitaleaceae bacterium]|jgi:NADH-quinone oxidoreductase subunit H|nr:NADH-quinone oxidoreductase subunit H [Vallitaleaceae bacterium]
MVALSIINVLIAMGVALFGFTLQTSVAGVNRKIIGRMQKRYGPKWYQEFRDIFKALSKRGITHGWVFDFGVMMALGGILATAMFMPVANIIAFEGYDNFFIFVYLFAVGMLGMAMSASGSGNPLASIGVMRALSQMVGYEVPFMVVILALVSAYNTSSISGLVAIQQDLGWNIIRLPIGALVAFICLQGMLGKKPFDTFIAPAEIASGPMVEYGGKQLGMLFIMHEVSVFVEVSLFVNIFLGGGNNVIEFIAKYFVVYTLANLIANTLGRFKIDQVITFYYKVPIMLALLQAGLIIFLGWGVN